MKRLRRLLVGVTLTTFLAVGLTSIASEAIAAPLATLSRYEATAGSANLYDQGCADGMNGRSGIHILDFGRPAYSGTHYGAIDFSDVFVSDATIRGAVENYANGWYACRANNTAFIFIAWGEPNDCLPEQDSGCGDVVPSIATAGAKLATYVEDVRTYIVDGGYDSQEAAAAGVDAEPAYDSAYTDTGSFVDNFNAGSGANMFDFGSAETGYWSNSQLYHVSWGASDDSPVPEVYGCCHASMVNEWLTIDEYAKSNSLGYSVLGVTSDYNSANSCNKTYTPDDSWNAMLAGIEGDSGAYYQSTIDYLTRLPCNMTFDGVE